MVRLILLIALAGLIAGLIAGCSDKKPEPSNPGGTPTTPPKADVTMALPDYLRERDADEKGTRAKYAGKTLDLTATVWDIHVHGPFAQLSVAAEIHPTAKVPVIRTLDLSETRAGNEKDIRLLTRGQKVTVRAKGNDGPGVALPTSVIVEGGPTTAIPTTLTAVGEKLKTLEGGTEPYKDGYPDAEVIVKAKVFQMGNKGAPVACIVTDADKDGGLRFLVRPRSPLYREELEKLKPGDVVTLLGMPGIELTQYVFDNARIITDWPAGLKK
jgi:hypothetical protein